ncbi:MAG TPA: hypothetical protein VGM75_30520 [Pseudonocardiaceae bacterium]|jgi:hypothetical protein
MSRGIGPVLLTHFTPDEAEPATVEETAPTVPGTDRAHSGDRARSGVIVAPAPTGKSARHRAGRGRRPLILAKPRPKSTATDPTDEAAGTTTQLPLIDQLRNTPNNLRILAMTAGAVLLIAVGFGMIRPATQLAGTPTPAGPNRTVGMQPGTLPDAALSGTPTTTVAPPPTTAPTTTPPPPPTHHTTTTHAAPPPVTSTETTQSGYSFDEPGQPCSKPGQFGIDSNYNPVECAGNTSGGLTWHEF